MTTSAEPIQASGPEAARTAGERTAVSHAVAIHSPMQSEGGRQLSVISRRAPSEPRIAGPSRSVTTPVVPMHAVHADGVVFQHDMIDPTLLNDGVPTADSDSGFRDADLADIRGKGKAVADEEREGGYCSEEGEDTGEEDGEPLKPPRRRKLNAKALAAVALKRKELEDWSTSAALEFACYPSDLIAALHQNAAAMKRTSPWNLYEKYASELLKEENKST